MVVRGGDRSETETGGTCVSAVDLGFAYAGRPMCRTRPVLAGWCRLSLRSLMSVWGGGKVARRPPRLSDPSEQDQRVRDPHPLCHLLRREPITAPVAGSSNMIEKAHSTAMSSCRWLSDTATPGPVSQTL